VARKTVGKLGIQNPKQHVWDFFLLFFGGSKSRLLKG